MRLDTLDVLRCPYCGGRLELVTSLFHQMSGEQLHNGILGCHCCTFPLVDGIPVMHLQEAAAAALEHLRNERPDLARRAMFGLHDPAQAETFDRAAASETATYQETVEAIGPDFEGGYFLYRFSDPTFVVAQAVVQSLARVVLDPSTGSGPRRRVLDICGGSGHLTRSLQQYSSTPPILADLFYAKIWLARRFTAPGCEPVCGDGNSPMPFARGAFSLAMCTDAFMYIWTKRQFVSEMERLVDDRTAGAAPGAVLIGHTHNARTWSASHGQALSPEAYAELFESMEPRLFAEGGLFDGIVDEGVLDLSRRDPAGTLDADPALTIVASRHPGVFTRHPIAVPMTASGVFRLNPLYGVQAGGSATVATLQLRFPNDEYQDEYGACRRYLPEALEVERRLLDALPSPSAPPEMAELVRRRIVLDLPDRYY
jgi:uncharacterized protein YbaR (Trm112 family)